MCVTPAPFAASVGSPGAPCHWAGVAALVRSQLASLQHSMTMSSALSSKRR